MPPRVALATCAQPPVVDQDAPLLISALAQEGIAGVSAVWDDPTQAWAAYDLVVVRSTWDYVPRREEFVAWAASVPRLANPAPVISWNTDKRYLGDLSDAGVTTVKTTWVAPGQPAVLPPGQFVVKPSVSVGSQDSARFGSHDHAAARALIEVIHRNGREAMIQPYMNKVDTAGESALVFIGGQHSHSVRKAATLTGPEPGATPAQLAESIRPMVASAEELEVARRVLAKVHQGDELLYARVDLVPGDRGEPVLLELELTEPALFLTYEQESPRRLARAIAEMLQRLRPA